MSAEDRVVYWKRRAHDAENEVAFTRESMESFRRWMTDTFVEERRLRDRCTHLYGMLRAQGLTADQIDGPLPEGTKFALTLVEVVPKLSATAALMDND